MQDNILKQLIEVVDKKFILNTKQCEWWQLPQFKKWLTSDFYLDAIKDEVDEVREELRDNNSVYLEDELWDILWDYLNLLHCLKVEWKADTARVLERCLEKYSERSDGLEQGISWDEIKVWQKSALEKEHNKKYNA